MPRTPTSKRFTLVDKEDYRVELEYNDAFAILHLPSVNKFTKAVYQDMLITIEDIREFVDTLGYEGLFIGLHKGNTKVEKLIAKLSFRYLGESDGIRVFGHKKGTN